MSIIQGTAKSGGTVAASFYDYPIGDSLRFDGSSYLQKNNFGTSAGSVNTFSFWMKLYDLSDARKTIFGAWYDDASADFDCGIGATGYGAANTLRSNWGGGANYNLFYISNKLRDISAWYHIVISFNSSNSSTNKVKKYINGTLITATTSADPSYTSFGRDNSTSRIGARVDGPSFPVSQQFKGYLANIQFIDGQELDPYFFGEFKDNIWVPYNAFSTAGSGTATASDAGTATDSYGTNGFHLDFADSSNIGNDVSGNNNDWTVN
jgi:hypothetical protein